MWHSAVRVAATGSFLLMLGAVSAQETGSSHSGPGPSAAEITRQYNVMVFEMGSMESGSITFARGLDNSTGMDPDDSGTDDSPDGTDTGAGNDPSNTTNPTAAGDYGTVGNPNGTPGNVSGNTSGSISDPGTGTSGTGMTNSGSSYTGTGGTGTTTTGATATGTTSDPPSYWTTARANGQVARQTNDPNSSDYWTTDRANGRVVAGDTSGSGGGGSGGDSNSGTFIASFTQSSAGDWRSIELGSFSLWYATGDSTDNSVTFVGYASADMIVGLKAIGTTSAFETLFTGSFFVGQVSEGDVSDEE